MRGTGVLHKIVSKCLTSVESTLIRKCWAHTERMMSVYLKGIAYGTLNMKEKATKIYKSYGSVLNSQPPVVSINIV